MKGIAIVNNKGGVGKTTIGHLLALGAAWNEVPAHFIHTDNRPALITDFRPYGYYDCRSIETLISLSESALYQDGLFIIDGGGNRNDFDMSYVGDMDLVIIPLTPSAEDIRVSLQYFSEVVQQNKNTHFVINRYPTNSYERLHIERKYLSQLPGERILHKVADVKASRLLLDDDDKPFQTPPTRVNNLARGLYRSISGVLIQD